ncbi:ATP-binding protein [Nocardiopsis sp. LOL_012]|uniref:ATP-binding protein n=1 Tax=Nocardiopsis sp. LOL_012 TaxID=3345409 RepID=UPI003A85E5F5
MRPTVPPLALPRRLCGTHTTSGLLIGPDPRHLRDARRWAAQATRSRPGLAEPVTLAVSELATNAQRHSASGLSGGAVRIEIERTRHRITLRVTDHGPRPGHRATLPAVPAPDPLRPNGNGLRLLDALCSY